MRALLNCPWKISQEVVFIDWNTGCSVQPSPRFLDSLPYTRIGFWLKLIGNVTRDFVCWNPINTIIIPLLIYLTKRIIFGMIKIVFNVKIFHTKAQNSRPVWSGLF